MPKSPLIRIRHSGLMTANISPILLKYFRGPEAELEDYDFYVDRAAQYDKAWREHEHKIIDGMTSVLGVDFFLPVIDATLAPMVPAFSTPLTLNYRNDPDEFVDTLTHELIHVLISDNKQGIEFYQAVREKWPNEEMIVRSHIMVHAVLEYIYREVLNDSSRLERDKRSVSHNPPYVRAWEIVEEVGYSDIIKIMLTEKTAP